MDRIIGTYIVDGRTIEYSITGKMDGEPVLVMHGGHSNCYEEFGYRSLSKAGFMIITPSRAGYGNTSNKIGTSLFQACYYYVELLNHLGIDKVHILSISAGGPSGLYFTSHFSERVKTLTLQSAVTKEWHTPKDRIYKLARVLFHPSLEKMTWKLTATMSNLFPKSIFTQMLPSFSKRSYKQVKEEINDGDIEAFRKMNNRQRSGSGFLIDLSQTKEISSNDVLLISVPTLIMHSQYDSAVSLDHAHYAHQHISNSELCILESWGHIIWLGKRAEDVNKKLTEFLLSYSKVS